MVSNGKFLAELRFYQKGQKDISVSVQPNLIEVTEELPTKFKKMISGL